MIVKCFERKNYNTIPESGYRDSVKPRITSVKMICSATSLLRHLLLNARRKCYHLHQLLGNLLFPVCEC